MNFQGGKFFYMEHIAAEKHTFANWLQRTVDPAWKVVTDGCRCSQETWDYINRVGFKEVKHEKFFVDINSFTGKLSWPLVIRYMLTGMAEK